MKTIYIEPDEEIISIIEKIGQESADDLAIVAPNNSALCQSLVNLKLLAKEAKTKQKKVAIITKDKVGERLARQIGLSVYSSPPPAPVADQGKPTEPEAKTATTVTETLPDGTTIHRFMPPQIKEPEVGVETSKEETPPSFVALPAESPEEPSQTQPEVAVQETPPEPESSLLDKPSVERPKSVELPPIVTTPHRGGGWLKSWSWPVIPWKSALIASIIIIICSVVVFTFLPKATVKLDFPATLKSQSITLTVKTIDGISETSIPGGLLETDKSGEKAITATGQKDIGTKATGTITIVNKYRDGSGAGKDQYFPAGTPATDSKTSKVFLLDRAVTVGKVTYNPVNGQPIYQSVSVAVTASAPGEDYNIAASSFSLQGELSSTEVTSSSAFSGGSSRQVTVLSQEDVDKAVAELTEQLAGEGKGELTEKAASQTVLDGSVVQTVTTQKLDHEVGSQVEQAKLEMTIHFATLAFDQTEAELKLTQAMEKDIAENEQLVIPDDKPISLTYQTVNSDNTEMTIEAKGEGFVAPLIDRQALAGQLNGKSVSAARSHLGQAYPNARAEFSFSPTWWPKILPLLSHAIKVDLSFYETAGA